MKAQSNLTWWSDLLRIDEKVLKIAGDLWNFQIITVDKNAITFGTLFVGSVCLFVGVYFSDFLSRKLTRKFFNRFVFEKGARATLESLVFYGFIIFFALFALRIANIPLTIFTILGSVVAIGVGFGSQNVVSNFISGIILMMERPVKVGDFIEVDGIFGEVEHIGIRSTNVLAFGNRHIIVPNSSFLDKNVYNWTRMNNRVRIIVKVGVAYGSPVEKVKELLLVAAQEEPGVLKDSNPEVFFTDFGDNSLNFELAFWILMRSLGEKREIESNLRFRINNLFEKNQIVIAFPQRDVHLYQAKPFEISMRSH